ncbi:nuclear transport factor 2 family protein [Amycolatopsis sp. NPDC059090]|uniref:nuclear transport factor 2 family protein n=1 Tax=unclassified Amycolatopsis TaxID=2618356 RepID=UPI0036727BEB
MSNAKLALYTRTMDEICAAVAAHDLDKVLKYFDDECVVVNGAGGTVGDKAALVPGFEEMFATFPDWTPRVAASFLEGDTIGVLFEVTGTVGGTGPKVTWIGTGYSTFDPETLKIVRDVYFMDEAALEQKINDVVSAE